MSDLISRKALLQKLEGKNSYSVNTATTEQIMKSYAYADCICIIEHEPTAYDVDEVVERLEELPHGEYKDDFGKGYAIAVKACIGIVKGAVKDESNTMSRRRARTM